MPRKTGATDSEHPQGVHTWTMMRKLGAWHRGGCSCQFRNVGVVQRTLRAVVINFCRLEVVAIEQIEN